MPRPKGSRNRKAAGAEAEYSVEQIEAAIAAAEAEIGQLAESLKAKKAELKALISSKEEALRVEAERKAEEDKAKIMAAVQASGKSLEEILEFLK